MNIGIDLGTTMSVIAVPGRVNLAEDYPAGIYLERCDVTIIPDPDGNPTIPSVLWAPPKEPGEDLRDDEIVLGWDAKSKLKDGENPIQFAKRAIGTDQRLEVNGHVFTAGEVAEHMLRYLKQCAEKALGQPVERAVVTHPAYFLPNQIEETRLAAARAGFRMELAEQLLMEPEAAALAYLTDEELRGSGGAYHVLTYDLGGGTFDVTVMTVQGGSIHLAAFDGDAHLGGYNFDRLLAEWILERTRERLAAQDRKLVLDMSEPEDRARYAALLSLAEYVKVELARQQRATVQVPVKLDRVLVDTEGRTVQVLDKVNRETFAKDVIGPLLDTTVDCCTRALGKAGLDSTDIRKVILVGGSCHGPWVRERLREAFPKTEMELFEPDLCVGAGAAVRARQLPQSLVAGDFELELDVPPSTALPEVTIAGRIVVR